ncbi:MAG: DUF2520 domain-containing protein [Burkholderiales bacterium]|nr:DUF2520 domain-containing protein [Burkholderiales bacterium]
MTLSLNVVGAGRLGKSMGRLFALQGVTIAGVLNRRAEQAELATAFIGQGRACTELISLPAASLHLLAVPDDKLLEVTGALLSASILRHGDLLFHCSGSKSSLELRHAFPELDHMRVALASVHPLFSFADPERAVAQFPSTICSMEGDAIALEILRPLFEQMGAKLVTIDARHKMLYHAGSVFASNYLVSLMDASIGAYTGAGVPCATAVEMARSLAQSSLQNVFELGPAAALTGPIKRGDFATVHMQEQVVRNWDRSRGDLYHAFIEPTSKLAQVEPK